MSNLGFYQTITTIIKKSGGPKKFGLTDTLVTC